MAGVPEAKQVIKIGTHNGVFHCDEVLACYLLKKLPQYKDATIVRTRDQAVLDTCDIVVDVGGHYDPLTHRYDHHQREFNETMNSLSPTYPWKIKLSSAGLIYYHFGRTILSKLIGKPEDAELVECAYKQIYEYFIQEIDGIDNGVPMFDGEPYYRITTSLSSRVGNLNTPWNAKELNQEENFQKAFIMVGKEFEDRVSSTARIWWPARSLVLQAVQNRFNVHPSGEIVEFPDGTACPWKEHLFHIEGQQKLEPTIKFVLFADSNNSWRVQAVPVAAGSYICRVFLLKEWQGLRDDLLSAAAGIDGCIFVHGTGFIGGNKTRDGAFKMAVKCLEQRDSES